MKRMNHAGEKAGFVPEKRQHAGPTAGFKTERPDSGLAEFQRRSIFKKFYLKNFTKHIDDFLKYYFPICLIQI